ncbi:holin-like protein [Sporosarcina luteola]|nr:holin-like protein [Sporosarcina luteola]
MKPLIICLQIGVLFIFSYIGTLIQHFFHLIIPGSIIGLLLLFLCLCLKVVPVQLIDQGAGFLLSILTLLFVPMTVGIMKYPFLLSWKGLLLFAAVLISTILTIGISGLSSQFFEKSAENRKEAQECNKRYTHSS